VGVVNVCDELPQRQRLLLVIDLHGLNIGQETARALWGVTPPENRCQHGCFMPTLPWIGEALSDIALQPARAHLSLCAGFGSEGTYENSPAFQCRDRLEKRRVPPGRLKRTRLHQCSDAASTFFSRPCGTACDIVKPRRLKRRAIFKMSHSGRSVFRCPNIEMRRRASGLVRWQPAS
jgi:hypothetical protein